MYFEYCIFGRDGGTHIAVLSERTRPPLHFIAVVCAQKLNIRPIYSHALSYSVRQHRLHLLFPYLGGLEPALSNTDMQDTSSSPRPNYRGPVKLTPYEAKWRDRQQFLESKGYMLRPRLRPGWTPSWLSTGQDYDSCEDSARLPVSYHDGSVDILSSLD